MKLTQYNVNIFNDELKALVNLIEEVHRAGEKWVGLQEAREKGSVNQYATQTRRLELETLLNKLRTKLATVYDFQGDRGMVDFIIVETNGHYTEPEPEPEEVVVEEENEIELAIEEAFYTYMKNSKVILPIDWVSM